MRRPYLLKYLQIIFFIIIGSVNFLNAIRSGNIFDWIIYAICMIGIMVVAFSIKRLRDQENGVFEGKPEQKNKPKQK